MVHIGNDWDDILKNEFQKDYYRNLKKFLINEYNYGIIYPEKEDIFNALKLTSFSNTSVVIIGQDPYHGAGQAHGLCFSVNKGVTPPPSLKNIFEEINHDLGIPIPNHGNLSHWAEQGVLLLNTVLTVRSGIPNSHKNRGWEILTDRIISEINRKNDPVVFLLWGANALQKQKLITNPIHYVLTSVHPSPLSAYRGFFGCEHFSKTNDFLMKIDKKPIDWLLL